MALLYEGTTSVSFSSGQAVQIQIKSNPIPTVITIDGVDVQTPATITLAAGNHAFSAPSKSPGMQVTYGFDRWTINGTAVSYNAVDTLDIFLSCSIKAEYTIAESGIYPVDMNSTSSPGRNVTQPQVTEI